MSTTTKAPLLAFHGSQARKDMYLARVRAHRLADEIISGKYWEYGMGCAVGCTIHSQDHAAYERELGIPRALAILEDHLFERLHEFDRVEARAWPERFLSAPRPGADLALVWPEFARWFLVHPAEGVMGRAREKGPVVELVAALCAEWIRTGRPPDPALVQAVRKVAVAALNWTDFQAVAAVAAAVAVAEAIPYRLIRANIAALLGPEEAPATDPAGQARYRAMADRLIALMTEPPVPGS